MVKAVIEKLFRDQNNRQVSGNVLWTVLIKGCAMLISILTVPSYVRYFGDNADGSTVYGAWLTISAVFTWINMFDFGIGNGLRNHLVKSIADKDSDTSKRLVSSAYVSVGIISLLFLQGSGNVDFDGCFPYIYSNGFCGGCASLLLSSGIVDILCPAKNVLAEYADAHFSQPDIAVYRFSERRNTGSQAYRTFVCLCVSV